MIADTIASMTRQVIAGRPLSRSQAERLVGVERRHLHDLFRGASQIRDHFVGGRVRCCSIVAAKVGRCPEDCTFCSQSARHKTPIQPVSARRSEEVFDAAMHAAASGAHSFGIVASGYGPTDGEIEYWGEIIRPIRRTGKVLVCASLGIVRQAQAARLAELGVQRYNLNLQTSRRHFPSIVTTHTYDDRLQALGHLKAARISLCSGALFAMGETWADRLDLAFELREIDPEVVPLNFLIPIDGTPLAGSEPLEPMECLKIIACYRFLLPRQEIKIAGGREVNLRDLQSWIFLAGADSFLIGNYLTTCGRPAEDDRQMLSDLGLAMADSGETPASPAPAPRMVLDPQHAW